MNAYCDQACCISPLKHPQWGSQQTNQKEYVHHRAAECFLQPVLMLRCLAFGRLDFAPNEPQARFIFIFRKCPPPFAACLLLVAAQRLPHLHPCRLRLPGPFAAASQWTFPRSFSTWITLRMWVVTHPWNARGGVLGCLVFPILVLCSRDVFDDWTAVCRGCWAFVLGLPYGSSSWTLSQISGSSPSSSVLSFKSSFYSGDFAWHIDVNDGERGRLCHRSIATSPA